MCFLSTTIIISTIGQILWLLEDIAYAFVIVKSLHNDTRARFNDMPAAPSFGRSIPDEGLWGHVAYTDPPDACTAVHLPSNASDWIAVISKSDDCQFHEQVLNAQKAGFMAAIVHNNESDDLYEMKDSSRHRLNIPSTFIGLSDSHLLIQYDLRKDVTVWMVEGTVSYDETILIVLAGISSFSAITVLGIVIGIGVHNCYRNRAQLLSRWKLKRLPLHTYKKGDLYESCAICLEEYDEGDKLRILPCAHAFHSKCIDEWLTKNKKTCPLCNETVNPGRRAAVSSRAQPGSDSERTPLLMPRLEDELNDEHGETSELLRNQSLVEVHQESPHTSGGPRNYGAAGTSMVVEAGASFAAQAVVAEGDSASVAGETVSTECPVLGNGSRKCNRSKLDTKPRQPQVLLSGRNSDRVTDNIV